MKMDAYLQNMAQIRKNQNIEFTQFSYPIATSDDKAMTLQISVNGEVLIPLRLL